MKSPIMYALMIASMAASVASAQAGEKTGQVSQALGEQCSVIASYHNTQNGGCSNSSSDGELKISVQAQIQAYKDYDVLVTVIDSSDRPQLAYQTSVRFNHDDVYSATDIAWTMGVGAYQVNLALVNHNTGVTVCSSQSVGVAQ